MAMRQNCALFVALAVAGAVSCSKTLEEPSVNGNLVQITLSASQQDTKTGIDGTHILWQKNDALSVFAVDEGFSNCMFTLEEGAGTSSAVFRGSAPASEKYFAIYPYDQELGAGAGIRENGITFNWDGTAQEAVKGSYDPTKAIMAGLSADYEISFRNLCSFVKITTDFACKSIGIYSPDYNIGQAEVKVCYDDNGSVSLKKINDSGNTAAIVAPDGGVIEPGTYYIAVLPTRLSGFQIKVTANNGVTLIRDAMSTGWLKMTPGKVLNVGSFTAADFDDADGFLGTGTIDDPYLIGNKGQFNLLRTLLSGSKSGSYISKSYKQIADIDFGGEAADFGTKGFNGTYDGDGHKLSNIVLKNEAVDSDESIYASALICKSTNAKISNLTVECKGFENKTGAETMYYGGFIGLASSTNGSRVEFYNCTFKSSESASGITTGNQDVCWGGFVGYNVGNLKCCYCTNEFYIDHNGVGGSDGKEFCFGGFVGKISGDDFDYWCNFNCCRNNGNVIVREAPGECYAGGFVGYVDEGTWTDDCTLRIVNSINRANIIANPGTTDDNAYAGGLVGKHDSDGGDCGDPLMFNCMNSGSISAAGDDAYAGGIFGWNYDDDTRVCACANVGNVYVDDLSARGAYYGALCGTDDGEYYKCAFTSGYILYKTYTTADNIHDAYSIDDAIPSGQLSADVMNTLAAGVDSSLRSELKDRTGFSLVMWTGYWNHQNQQGLDLAF